MDERAAFEAWGAPFGYYFGRDDHGRYRSPITREALFAYEAGRAAGLREGRERAASIADDAGEPDRYKCYATGKRIAERIRAMGDERAREIDG